MVGVRKKLGGEGAMEEGWEKREVVLWYVVVVHRLRGEKYGR